MTAKEAKAYLMQYRESMARAHEITDHLAELKAEAIRLKDHEGNSVVLDAAVAKYVDACDDAAAYLAMLAERRKEIAHVIDSVQNTRLRELLTERYINGKTWEQVAVQMNYSYVHIVHRLHPAALRAVQEILTQN